MNTVPRNPFILLIVVALVAGSWPAALLGGTNLDPQGEPCAGVHDPCCGDELCSAGSHTESEDCCPTGCDDCYLACCAGMISLLPSVVTMASGQAAVSIVCQYHGDPSPARGGDIDHPPRA